jgi:hypothetical protein
MEFMYVRCVVLRRALGGSHTEAPEHNQYIIQPMHFVIQHILHTQR